MKNKQYILVLMALLFLVIYGLFSLSVAVNVLFPEKIDAPAQPVKEIITPYGNKIEYYDI